VPPGNISSTRVQTNFLKPSSCSKDSVARGKPPKIAHRWRNANGLTPKLFQELLRPPIARLTSTTQIARVRASAPMFITADPRQRPPCRPRARVVAVAKPSLRADPVQARFWFHRGVEWLATEKIKVHGCSGLAWDNPTTSFPNSRQLNRLLAGHPCFFDGANSCDSARPTRRFMRCFVNPSRSCGTRFGAGSWSTPMLKRQFC